VIPDLYIWRAADLLIRRHGAGAELVADRLHHVMIERGNDEGRLLWAQIRRAIEVLLAPNSGRSS
jgi:hypothetical protein